MIHRVTGDGRLVPLGKRDRGPEPRQDRSSRPNRGHRWMKLRSQILARDPVCRVCNQAEAVQVDHIVPLSQGGGDEYSNLQGICLPCHKDKTAREQSSYLPRVETASEVETNIVRHRRYESRNERSPD